MCAISLIRYSVTLIYIWSASDRRGKNASSLCMRRMSDACADDTRGIMLSLIWKQAQGQDKRKSGEYEKRERGGIGVCAGLF
jgi:hypothetical protein